MSIWKMNIGWILLISSHLVFDSFCVMSAAKNLRAEPTSQSPWWIKQTAMTPTGAIILKNKSWWPRAIKLKVDEEFLVESVGEAARHMLVRREKIKPRSGEIEALVWIIDDDLDGGLQHGGGDKDSDCYVVDYGGDGQVDRMVDYIDNDDDNDPDEMDIRYFVDGELRFAWFGADLDDDGEMWSLTGYEYDADFFSSDPYGDSMIYMNKFNPLQQEWIPISECPFAFYDTDRDSFSEVVVRVSAVPLHYDISTDPDYANDYRRFRARWDGPRNTMGVVNIRYSFDIDHGSSLETPLHYDFGFNLVGAAPYEYPGMDYQNPHRRPPQVTRVIPWKDVRKFADEFEAKETGFSWQENFDDTVAIGSPEKKECDYRWEGIFWLWERRFMENTGGPCQKWNMRREWSRKSTGKRELYYSDVDKRIHLFGAEEGWIEVGHFGGLGALGEIRIYDSDGNGYFDRWEVYLDNNTLPVRVSTVRDECVRKIDFDPNDLSRLYTREILPQARKANKKFMKAMSEIIPYKISPDLEKALQTGSESFCRYAQDVARELQYQDFREHFMKKAGLILHVSQKDDLRHITQVAVLGTKNSHAAWKLLRILTELDILYGQGKYDQCCPLLRDISKLLATAQLPLKK